MSGQLNQTTPKNELENNGLTENELRQVMCTYLEQNPLPDVDAHSPHMQRAVESIMLGGFGVASRLLAEKARERR